MLVLQSTSLTSGLPYDKAALDLVKAVGPVAWLEGGLNKSGKLIDRLTGRSFSPRSVAPTTIAAPSSGRAALHFAGGGPLAADDGVDTFTSLTDYSVLAVTRIPVSGGGGIFVSNDLAYSGAAPMVGYINTSTFLLSANGSFTGGAFGAGVTAENDAVWHTNILSVAGASNGVVRQDGASSTTNANDKTMSSASGGKRLLMGGNANAAYLPFTGDIALLIAFPFALHTNPTALAAVEAYAAEVKTEMVT